MGSSPVTATTSGPPVALLLDLEPFLAALDPAPGGVLVAFSAGPDSTALLYALAELARRRPLSLWAAHLDHGLDPDSRCRARAAAEIARALAVPFFGERREVQVLRQRGESLEAAARRIRYAFLEERRREVGADWVATAHHAGDQAETVLLRLAAGSGPAGLAGIRPRRERLIRPLLGHSRRELEESLAGSGLRPVEDPTNRCLEIPRNRIRARLLPRLRREDPALPRTLAAVASAARLAFDRLEARLGAELSPRLGSEGISVARAAYLALPEPLRPLALALLHRQAGAPYPASAAARRELAAQLERRGRLGCDCGGGWRWESRGRLLLLTRQEPAPAPFSYTLTVPGELPVPELGVRLRLSQGPPAAWMLASWPDRVGLALPVPPGESLVVRSRRPGDRLRPSGRSRERRLKEVLDRHRVPRRQRDRLPLLCVGEKIAWVPGVALDGAFRLEPAASSAWIAEMLPMAPARKMEPAESPGPFSGLGWQAAPGAGPTERKDKP